MYVCILEKIGRISITRTHFVCFERDEIIRFKYDNCLLVMTFQYGNYVSNCNSKWLN